MFTAAADGEAVCPVAGDRPDDARALTIVRTVLASGQACLDSRPAAGPVIGTQASLQTLWANPIMLSDGRPGGVIVLSFAGPWQPDAGHLDILARLSTLARVAIEHARSAAELQAHQANLEQLVAERTAQIAAANVELEAFAYSVSHDLRTPLRGIDGFARALAEDYGDRLDANGHDYLQRIRRASQRLGRMIDDLLAYSGVSRREMATGSVDLSALAREVVEELRRGEPERGCEVSIEPGCRAEGDETLLRILLQNLLGNAWKFTAGTPAARIGFGRSEEDGEPGFCVSDNGVGFDMKYAERLFQPFQRLHRLEEFEGSGVGLASAERIIGRHGGRIRIASAPGEGTRVVFVLGTQAGAPIDAQRREGAA